MKSKAKTMLAHLLNLVSPNKKTPILNKPILIYNRISLSRNTIFEAIYEIVGDLYAVGIKLNVTCL
ncbi:hypothetical protein SAMN04488552_0099 [Christiangramia echinicola]|uniref:Uncharacterized protein n=1 Tax=Christiangramia echinicola TaxID=279359 RepID=A0A1H1KSK7_9FLAO|nr:hypothetical protein SAMN04488552_0099 [Christiangramia echinicola]